MLTCSSCRRENPDGFAFCGFCGAPLAEKPPATPAEEERKVVSVLFCDLVGFTAASEDADPEDVLSRLRPYYARLRREIEGYGGTVGKFIGDAVMGVWGAPTAYEDDAERAVRCALRILEAIEELNAENATLLLRVRIGINTGEAVVAFGDSRADGEGLVLGDVVNTASRLQSAAPVNAIACSAQTFRQTERVFDYEELEPIVAKGKSLPVAVFRPLAARARFGAEVTRTYLTPLVGRTVEKPLLIDSLECTIGERCCRLVTIVGEPGVGKSRLCAELFGHVDERAGLIRWRQGRCLPYGEGVALWALREIVKAECGILESDSPDEAEAKLEQAISPSDPDFIWLKARLAPLVGAAGEPAAQEESFTAWRRTIESWASARDTVLIFEDLHWADPSLLSFIEHVAANSHGVPLLLVCTARPELYEQRPDWAEGLPNATTIHLDPLTEDETADLVASLLDRVALPAEVQQVLLERAGGNPLYAEEFVRLVADRGRTIEAIEQLPDSVHALIAARLDTLSRERKQLLQDAAVVGKVFWTGALAEMGAREAPRVDDALQALGRKQLVRPAHAASMQGEREYAFWHALVRDVCYGQIPRVARAARHEAAASWLERAAGDRAADLADVLAHHYVTALELIRAAGKTEQARELEAAARRSLVAAGERALGLDVASAEHSFARALALCPSDDPRRGHLLERWAQAAQQLGRLHEARQALEEALAFHRERGDALSTGRALTALAEVLWPLGDPQVEPTLTEALAVLEGLPPGPELIAAHIALAGLLFRTGRDAQSFEAAEAALALARELGLDEPVGALSRSAGARGQLGDEASLPDMARALSLALEQGQGRAAAVLFNNLALAVWEFEGPSPALETSRAGTDFAERRGITELAILIGVTNLTFLRELGLADEALAEAALLAERAASVAHTVGFEARAAQLSLLSERGDAAHPPVAPDQLAAGVRETGQIELMEIALAASSQMLLAQGRQEEARALLSELSELPAHGHNFYFAVLPESVRCALSLGDGELAARLVEGCEPLMPRRARALLSCRAQIAEAAGEHGSAAQLYAEAAERWRGFGNVPELAYALLGEGRCLSALGWPKPEAPLREARELFTAMGFKPALVETTRLLQGAAASPDRTS